MSSATASADPAWAAVIIAGTHSSFLDCRFLAIRNFPKGSSEMPNSACFDIIRSAFSGYWPFSHPAPFPLSLASRNPRKKSASGTLPA